MQGNVYRSGWLYLPGARRQRVWPGACKWKLEKRKRFASPACGKGLCVIFWYAKACCPVAPATRRRAKISGCGWMRCALSLSKGALADIAAAMNVKGREA